MSIKKIIIAKVLIVVASTSMLAFAAMQFKSTFIDSKINEHSQPLSVPVSKKDIVLGNVNKELVTIGWDDVDVDKDKGDVFFLEYSGEFYGIGYEDFSRKLDLLEVSVSDGDTVYINVNSSGGFALFCSTLANRFKDMSSEFNLKTISHSTLYSYSCGFMMMAAADTITMDKGASVGNIGVITSYKSGQKGIVEYITGEGIGKVGSTRIKELLGGAGVSSKEDLDVFKYMNARSAKQFFDFVLDGRDGRISDEKLAFSGLNFNYHDAKKVGIVDKSINLKTELRKLHAKGYRITEIK